MNRLEISRFCLLISSLEQHTLYINQRRLRLPRTRSMCASYRVIRNDCRGFNNCHLVPQMQPHVISFYGVTSRIRFMFLLFPRVSRNLQYESEKPLKPSPLTCETNSIIALMFVESQRVHI